MKRGKLATVTRLKADFSSVSPSSERIKELWVALRLYGEWWTYASGRNMENKGASRRSSRKRWPSLLPVSPMYIFLHKLHVTQ